MPESSDYPRRLRLPPFNNEEINNALYVRDSPGLARLLEQK